MAGNHISVRRHVFLIAILIGMPLISSAESENVRVALIDSGFVHTELPSGSTASLSIANLGGPPGNGQGNCAYVEAVFDILGTLSDLDETPASELALLHRETVKLMIGQVVSRKFVTPSEEPETVIFATYTSPGHRHCLSQSAVSISTPIGFGFLGGAPLSEGHENWIEPMSISIGSLPFECCACAPLCGCGICDK